MSNPWDMDYFNPPTPHVVAPSPRARAPKLVPEIDDLFRVQRDALKTLHALDALEAALDDKKCERELKTLRVELENTYKVIRTYLAHYGQ